MGSQIKAGLTPLSWEILSGDYKENLRGQISVHCQEMGGTVGEVPDHRPIAQKLDKLPEKKKKKTARKKASNSAWGVKKFYLLSRVFLFLAEV